MIASTCRVPNHEGHHCGARSEGVICTRHLNQIRDLLAGTDTVQSISQLLTELDVTISRQDRGTEAPLITARRGRVQLPGVHYEEGATTLIATPWAFGWDASEVRWNVENTIVTWARHIAETRGVEIPVQSTLTKTIPASSLIEIVRNRPRRLVRQAATTCQRVNPTYVAELGRWLLGNLDSIRVDEAAVELHDELRAVHRDALQAIDRQVPDEFLGRCDAMVLTTWAIDTDEGETLVPELAPCGVDLYIRTGDDEARCGACGAVYDAHAKRVELKSRIPDALGTPATIVDALKTPENGLERVALNRWIERDWKQTERSKEGPTCADDTESERCGHRTCEALRAAEIQAIVKRQGRPMIYRQGWDSDGRSVYRAGDVQARLAWNESVKSGRMRA